LSIFRKTKSRAGRACRKKSARHPQASKFFLFFESAILPKIQPDFCRKNLSTKKSGKNRGFTAKTSPPGFIATRKHFALALILKQYAISRPPKSIFLV
jgi:hypothetical protein